MKRSAILCVGGMLLVAGCAVDVIDRTVSPFSYNPPINPQTFRVEVNANSTVKGVEFNSAAAGIAPMTNVGDDLYQLTTPVPDCAGAVEFSVKVTTQGVFSDNVDTFPEAGGFTHQVTGLPAECADFAENFAQTFVVNRFEDFPDSHPGDGVCQGIFSGPGLGCSLRAAVMEANAKPGVDLIRVPAGRYLLTRIGTEGEQDANHSIRDLDITESVTIEGTSGANADLSDFLQRTNDHDRPDRQRQPVRLRPRGRERGASRLPRDRHGNRAAAQASRHPERAPGGPRRRNLQSGDARPGKGGPVG